MPCGNTNMPAPKLRTSLPDSSNFKTTSSGENVPAARSVRQLLAPQRSATQMDLPSLSMSTALVEPHARPSGILAHPSMVWNGLGAVLVGSIWVWALDTSVSSTTAPADVSPNVRFLITAPVSLNPGDPRQELYRDRHLAAVRRAGPPRHVHREGRTDRTAA